MAQGFADEQVDAVVGVAAEIARGNEIRERQVGQLEKLVAAVDRLESRLRSVEDTISSASLFGRGS